MNLAVRGGKQVVELDRRERVILHLLKAGRDIGKGMARTLEIPYPSLAKILLNMEDEGVIYHPKAEARKYHNVDWKQIETSNGSWLWELTDDGHAVADAIRKRMT